VKTPIATGERLIGVHAFRDLLEKRRQRHPARHHPLRRLVRSAPHLRAGRGYRVAVAPHNPQGPVSTAASLELGFATPSYIICETVHSDVPWRAES
jgi:galactonate dehydratase